jgi:hypothetical protein
LIEFVKYISSFCAKQFLAGWGSQISKRERLGNPGGLITRRAVFITATYWSNGRRFKSTPRYQLFSKDVELLVPSMFYLV